MLKKLIFLFITVLLHAEEIDLSSYECSLYSQQGEDGILRKIFQLIKSDSQFCVELGAAEGVVGPTYLLRLQGWNGLLFDRNHEKAPHSLYREFLTAENVNAILEKYKAPTDFDLLSIHLGYNDFYLWSALDEKYRPYVVVIGYNSTLTPLDDKVVKYRPFYVRDGTTYFGASILALYNLGKSKGYALVYAEKTGRNLFFIREDLLESYQLTFKDMNNVEKLYQPSAAAPKADPKNREYVTSF